MKFNHKSETYVKIDSAKIYYEEVGNPQKQPLIFLHGGFGNIEDFNGIIPLLENEYRIIGIDNRGQGKSTIGTNELTYERLEKDVAFIIKKLNLKNPVIVGFSDGGTAALRLACFNKLDIGKLILIGTSWHTKSLENSKVFLEAITPEKWKEKFPKTFEKYQSINPEPDFDYLTKAIVKMWIDEKETGHPDDDVQNINCPTLIIRGDKDHLISKQSTFELSEKIEDSNLANIPFCGHEVYAEQPNLLMNMINEFLRK
jgi:pimeloyl-ACP methyl ester carboxylesterase